MQAADAAALRRSGPCRCRFAQASSGGQTGDWVPRHAEQAKGLVVGKEAAAWSVPIRDTPCLALCLSAGSANTSLPRV